MRPSRGEVWQVNLDPVIGHETGRVRPGLVVSVDQFNHGPAGLVMVLPLTTVDKGIPTHVPVDPPEGGVDRRSFVRCEEIRCLSNERLLRRRGEVAEATMGEVEYRLRVLLGL